MRSYQERGIMVTYLFSLWFIFPVAHELVATFFFFWCIIHSYCNVIGDFQLNKFQAHQNLLVLILKFAFWCFYFMRLYDKVLFLGFTVSGLCKLIHCVGFFVSTRQDKYGIAAVLLHFYLKMSWYFSLASLCSELSIVCRQDIGFSLEFLSPSGEKTVSLNVILF